MSTRLVVLGLLREQQLYGYEIKQLIEEQMGDWTNIAFGSIYYALSKLDDEGFIERVATEQVGNRPSRSIYRIAEAGRREFLRLLREVWTGVESQQFDLDLGVFFIEALPATEVEEYLEQRATILVGVVDELKEHQRKQLADAEIPPLECAICGHSLVHAQAELAWTHDLLKKVRQDPQR
ncbi:MAG: PadR family transcriptional regulator [Anaerolineae bacterium]